MESIRKSIGVITRIHIDRNEKVCSAEIAEIIDCNVVETNTSRKVSEMCYNLQDGYFVVINEDGSIGNVLTIMDMPLVIEEMRLFKSYFTDKLIEARKNGNIDDASNYYTMLENIKFSFKLYDSYTSSPAPAVNYIK